ncbi:MAG TPA: sigma 54-interacting transcriptional regulator [Bryobacteraceae bacterium]|nr:sigma 54-interacting transcriptional regulator [Bryobacteraceae bacterium]
MSKLAPDWRTTSVFEAVFDQLPDALVLWDPEFRITGVNRSAETLFGMSSREMLGKHCREVFRSSVCEAGCGVLVGLEKAPSARGTLRLNTGNGTRRLVVMRTSQILDGDGQLAGVAATIQDITTKAAPPTRPVIAESAVMLEILNFVRRIAASDAATILLDGENGTGKDLIAKTLHYQSLRQAEPFIAVNCAAIPDTLLESELFGYERGAFTDARAQKRGIFELADRGTLFLDEIGEIPMVLQAKLLQVLEAQTIRRVGGLTDIQLDLRVVAATNKNLREAVKTGAFRQDLYFRLNVIQITVPPLRQRTADIQPLARFFIEHYNRKFKRSIAGLSDLAVKMLLSYDWPGNVRELRNAIERGMILEESALITSSSLPVAISRPGGHVPPGIPENTDIHKEWTALEDSERSLLARALQQTGGNQTRAARLLGVTLDTLRYKKRKLDLS